jgi:Cof subfamily protein (haloacid dehalogenase superfamily)
VTAHNLESLSGAPKVVAADLDGTLLPLVLDGSQSLTPLTVQTVRTLTRLGIRTIIVTGRMFASAAAFAGQLGLTGPVAAHAGALIREVGSGRLLHHDPLPLGLSREVLAFVEPEQLSVSLYFQDQLCVEKRTGAVDRYEALSKMKAVVVGRLLDHLDQPTTKIGIGGQPPVLDNLQARLRQNFGARIVALKTWPFFLEITNPTATKARALEIIGVNLGFGPGDVLAFGDSFNDADMLAWAGTGVAMAGAPPEVAAVADDFCGTVEDDGVARYLMRQPWFPRGD